MIRVNLVSRKTPERQIPAKNFPPGDVLDANCAICAQACLVHRQNFEPGHPAVCTGCAFSISLHLEAALKMANEFLIRLTERRDAAVN